MPQWCRIEKYFSHLTPQARSGHSAVVYEKNIYVIGGKSRECLSDLWCFHSSSFRWEKVDIADNFRNLAREQHSVTVLGDTMYVFGGLDSAGKEKYDLLKYQFDGECALGV